MRKNNPRRKKYHRGRRNKKKINIISIVLMLAIALSGILLVKFIVLPITKNYNSENINKKTEESTNRKKGNKAASGVIELQGQTKLTINLGEEYVEEGYLAHDEIGNNLTEQVQVDTSELSRAGNRKIKYSVTDKNGNEVVAIREVEVLPNTNYPTNGLPICMFHYVYDDATLPEKIDSNFITVESLDEEMQYLKNNNYYFPTWQEVRDYVDGKILLPERSIVITFDDGPNFMELGIPVLEKYQIPATSFVITSYWDSAEMLHGYASDYLTFESHSHDMHKGGGSTGHGGIYTALSREEILEDLSRSFEICGNSEAFAYPYGDYTEEGCSYLQEAGILCAVTTENDKCYPGQNPYLLPRVRMLGTQNIDAFVAAIQ